MHNAKDKMLWSCQWHVLLSSSILKKDGWNLQFLRSLISPQEREFMCLALTLWKAVES